MFSGFYERHAEELPTLLTQSSKLLIESLEGQTKAAKLASETLGYEIKQPLLSKAIHSGQSVFRIHTILTLTCERLNHNQPTWGDNLKETLCKPIKGHQLCEIKETHTPCVVRSCYQKDGSTYLIVMDKNAKEHHLPLSKVDIIR